MIIGFSFSLQDSVLMIALAPPGSPQHGTLASEPEGPCQSLSWVVGRSFEFGPCDEHFPQLAHFAKWKFKTFPLFTKAVPMHLDGFWLKAAIAWHYWHFYASFGTPRISAKWRFGFRAWRNRSTFELGGGRVLGIWAIWWAFPPICSCDEILITLQNENSKHSHCFIKQFRYT